MKYFACLFALVLGFLTVLPVFSFPKTQVPQPCCSRMVCRKTAHPKQQQDHTGECGKSGCNPFLACASGNFYVMEKPMAPLFSGCLGKQQIPSR
jgi:hypothetical protein